MNEEGQDEKESGAERERRGVRPPYTVTVAVDESVRFIPPGGNPDSYQIRTVCLAAAFRPFQTPSRVKSRAKVKGAHDHDAITLSALNDQASLLIALSSFC